MSKCPNCGAPGGGASGCGSCGFGKVAGVGRGLMGSVPSKPNPPPRSSSGGGPGGGGGGCFAGDSLVLTPSGEQRLDRLNEGDAVLSMNRAGDVRVATIVRLRSHAPQPVLRVCSTDFQLSFSATPLHPVQTQRGWVRVKDLRKGDRLTYVRPDGRRLEHSVERVEALATWVPVYNPIVDGDHTFIVRGCVAHSFVRFRLLRCWMHALLHTAPRDHVEHGASIAAV